MALRVLCVGECMAELSADGDGYRLAFGGDTLNTALYMARLLGPGQVGYVTRLGDDVYSTRMRAAWLAEGIDCTLVETVPGATVGLYAIDTDARGERSFTYWRDAAPARALFTADGWEARARSLGKADMIYFSGISLAILPDQGRERLVAAAAAARARGATVGFDPNYRPRLWDPSDAANWCGRACGAASIALTSAEEEAVLAPEAASPFEHIAVAGCVETVAKSGAGGVSVFQGQTRTDIPAPETRAVDTTGAGDAFNAAYLAARLGMIPPPEAARRGCALGARVVAYPGAIIPRDAMQDLIGEADDADQ